MKHSSACAMLLGLMLLGVGGGANASLITNGTFDTDLSGWSQTGTTTGNTWDNGTVHIGRPGTPGTAIFFQDFDIPVGADHIKIWFDYEWQVNRPSQVDSFTVELDYESLGGPLTVELLSEGSDVGLFNTTVSFHAQVALVSLDPMSPNATLRFRLDENNSPTGTRIELDNVEVKVVEPTTLAILGLSLVAAGCARRRRRNF